MQFLLPPNKLSELTFNVSIAGTSAKPSTVYVTIERAGVALSFTAKNVDSTHWIVVFDDLGKVFSEGDATLTINVMIGSNLFTPYKSVATILGNTNDIEIVAIESEVINKPVFIPNSSIKEDGIDMVEIKPIKLQLLKTIEVMSKKTTPIKPVVEKVVEKAIIAEAVIPFSFKKVDIIYLD